MKHLSFFALTVHTLMVATYVTSLALGVGLDDARGYAGFPVLPIVLLSVPAMFVVGLAGGTRPGGRFLAVMATAWTGAAAASVVMGIHEWMAIVAPVVTAFMFSSGSGIRWRSAFGMLAFQCIATAGTLSFTDAWQGAWVGIVGAATLALMSDVRGIRTLLAPSTAT